MSTILATFWRSMGGHTRAVRWGTSRGLLGHYAVELWDTDRERWFYYDMNLNGFAYDDDNQAPLPVASIRSNLLTGEHLHLSAHPTRHDFTVAELLRTIQTFPIEFYVLNNDYLRWGRKQRFGIFNRFYTTLAGLPHPWDRIADNVTGARDRRLIVQGRITVGGWFSLAGARLFLGYLLSAITLCVLTLRRTSLTRPASTPPPTAVDTPPSR
jgi:hypothetical protein